MQNALKYLLNMKRLPIVILTLVAGFFLAFQTLGSGTKNPLPTKYEEILKLVGEMLSQAHYSPQDIDDAFSKKIFKKYIDELDTVNNMYMQADIYLLKNSNI